MLSVFMAGISPTKAAGQVPTQRIAARGEGIEAVLVRALAAGGTALRGFVHPDGQLGYFSHEWRVYGREGEPCRQCNAPVKRLVQGGRSTFFCGKCQR